MSSNSESSPKPVQWVHNPYKNQEVDVSPLFMHFRDFADSPQEYAEEIDEVMFYMMQGLNPQLNEIAMEKVIELHFMLRKLRDTFRAMSVKA